MATIIVKITDGKDIRRFTASTDISYDKIHKHAADGFNLGSKSFKLKYKDDEGDQITMSTDSEIQEAVSLTLKLEPPVLRLTLVPNSRAPSPARGAAEQDTPPELAAVTPKIHAPSGSLGGRRALSSTAAARRSLSSLAAAAPKVGAGGSAVGKLGLVVACGASAFVGAISAQHLGGAGGGERSK